MVPVCGAPLHLISTPRERGGDTWAQVSLDMSLCSLFSILLALQSWAHTYSNVPGVEAGMWGVSLGGTLSTPPLNTPVMTPTQSSSLQDRQSDRSSCWLGGDNVLGKICSQGKPLKQPEAFLLQFSTSGPPARR